MKKLSIINENIFDGIGRRSKGDVVRKEDYIEKIDLGLPSGTIWAAWNLGASSPEECGDYYAWGETEIKNNYSWYTYKFGIKDKLTKYNKKDGKTILDPEDDVAHVILGGKWHIPTKEQIQELFDNTTNKKSELNGVTGRLFTSKTNSKTLFFPYSGIKSGPSYDEIDYSAHYWSASLYENLTNYSMTLYSDNFDNSMESGDLRCFGLSVRTVLDKK